MVMVQYVTLTNNLWWWVVMVTAVVVIEVASLNGPNVCMVQQKYNITKRVKYRAPMSVRTYEWCFSMPPRCSKWKTEMRELTKLETDERIAEVAVCCPGYKMKDVSCVAICPNGKTGHHCSEDCPPNKWGPNCVNECKSCSNHGTCSPITGECSCQDGWQGESCDNRMPSTTSTTTAVEELLTKATKPTTAYPSAIPSSSTPTVESSPSTELILTQSRTTPANIYSSTFANSSTTQAVSTSAPTTASPTTVASTTTKATTVTTSTTTTPVPITTSLIPVTEKTTVEIKTTLTTLPTVLSTSPTTIVDHTVPVITIISTTAPVETTTPYNNLTTIGTTQMFKPIEVTKTPVTKTAYNRTEKPQQRKNAKDIFVEVKTIPDSKIKYYDTTKNVQHKTTMFNNVTISSYETSFLTTTDRITKETTRRPESTFKYFPTTVKFKPKEIWIRPAQKGESFETKINKELISRHKPTHAAPNTTPKTIIVSIIPTSVSYTTFKKISLSTASSLSQKTNNTAKAFNKTNDGVTRPMTTSITTSLPIKLSTLTKILTSKSTTNSSKIEPLIHKVTKPTFRSTELSKTTIYTNGSNSMTTVKNLNSSHFITAAPLTNAIKTTHKPNVTSENITTFKAITVTKPIERVTKHPFIKIVTVKPRNVTIVDVSGKINDTVKITKTVVKELEKTNVTKTRNDPTTMNANAMTNRVTTERSEDEETFHILTEPEHITAVMDGKGKEQASVDLISVISIAVGIMMIIITVAVIIVMIERCRRPRYEDVRKINDIHMQVMIDNNDVPPPYVRSIFHTPLPDPPSMEKCHYQPISTLDRNLKQFMRPVVVQSISPIMLENFRGILECHYDHLPRRSHDFEISPRHYSITPSMEDVDELTCLRSCSVSDSTIIEAFKCEAKMDVIDNTTSEPLYAEIPCWRPPSEHAIEIMNLNGEAVTEL